MDRSYYVYFIGNERPTLYIGVTNDLVRRVYEHKCGSIDGFSKTYGLTRLLYYECFKDPTAAISREKQLKHWRREWKLNLIKEKNPQFRDLYSEIV